MNIHILTPEELPILKMIQLEKAEIFNLNSQNKFQNRTYGWFFVKFIRNSMVLFTVKRSALRDDIVSFSR